jgi:hypothetical protein
MTYQGYHHSLKLDFIFYSQKGICRADQYESSDRTFNSIPNNRSCGVTAQRTSVSYTARLSSPKPGEAADGAVHSCISVAVPNEPCTGIALKLWWIDLS